jgi:hypothetical protein
LGSGYRASITEHLPADGSIFLAMKEGTVVGDGQGTPHASHAGSGRLAAIFAAQTSEQCSSQLIRFN